MTHHVNGLRRGLPLVLAGLVLAGCSAGAGTTPAAPASPAACPCGPASGLVSPSPSPSPSVTTGSSASPTATGSPSACVLPEPGPLASDTLVDATLARDRLVFTFGSRPPEAIAQPVVGIGFAEPPFSMAGSGQPVSVFGDRFLKVRMDGMVIARPNGEPVFTGERDLRLAGGSIPEAVMVDESEGVVTWIVGLAGAGCPTVSRDTTGGEQLLITLAR